MSARDPNDWMWERAAELLERTAWVQRRFFQVAAERGSAWEPPADVFESGAELVVLVALPGVSSRQCEVVLDEAGLVVRGQRPMPSVLHRAAIHRLEIPYGRFERRISLPPGNYRLHEQLLEDGCLMLVLRPLQ